MARPEHHAAARPSVRIRGMVTLATVGSYLYRSLATQLELRDDSELIGKVTQTRHLLEECSRSTTSSGRESRF